MPNTRKTHQWFKEQADLIYGPDTFTYLTEYEVARKPILLRCNACGREFTRVANLHLRQPHGCISCSQITERHSEISQTQHEIIEGLLISDGGLNRQLLGGRLSTPVFMLKSITKEFVDYVDQALSLEFSLGNIAECDRVLFNEKVSHCQELFVLQSKSDHALVPYWERWYNGEKKHIPIDFVLTPLTARFWFYGDGSSSRHPTGAETSRVSLVYCTHGFTWEDCERLCELWKAVGVPFHIVKDHIKDQPVLTINKADYIHAFFEYLGEPEIESFRYKWKLPVTAAEVSS